MEVHHVVMLQPPNCVTGTLPGTAPGTVPIVPGTYPQPPVTTAPPTPGIFDRMNTNVNATMPKRPSRCVWAIVACCSPDSTAIR